MTFTDDDLKRLKEKTIGLNFGISLDWEDSCALIDRLEKAEKCLMFSGSYVEGSDIDKWKNTRGIK